MKLFGSNTSPYVRKVRVTALEKGLEGLIDMTLVNAFEDPPALHEVNPIGKIPALVTSDDGPLYDSRVICAYLDALKAEPRLIPTEGAARWTVLRTEALGDGVLDAAVAIFVEKKKAVEIRDQTTIDRLLGKIDRAAATLDTAVNTFPPTVSLAHISAAVTLAYVDFRVPEAGWRDGRPALTAWFEDFSARPAMTATAPKE